MTKSLVTASVCFAGYLLIAVQTYGAVFRTVAVTGQPAPGTAPGVRFASFHNYVPSINNLGQVAFASVTTGGDFSSNVGIWSEGQGSLHSVVRTGFQAPGAPPGMLFWQIANPVINDAGRVAFLGSANVTGTAGAVRTGMWVEDQSSVRLAALEGEAAAGQLGDAAYGNLQLTYRSPKFNNLGQVLLENRLAGAGVNTTNDDGIWLESNGILNLVAREGQPASGYPMGWIYGDVGYSPSSSPLNNLGDAVFTSKLAGAGAGSAAAIWKVSGGNTIRVINTDQTVPNLPYYGRMQAFGRPRLNDRGTVAFAATFNAPNPAEQHHGIFLVKNGVLQTVARSLAQLPGTPAELATYSYFSSPVLNAEDETAFVASGFVNGVQSAALWSEGLSGMHVVARLREKLPQTADNLVANQFGHVAMNKNGQVAFSASLAAPGSTQLSGVGIWAESITGQLRLIAKVGDNLEVGPGDFRQISELRFGISSADGSNWSGNQGGQASAMNDLGQVTFAANFSDGTSGIFVSNVVAVPEPSSVAIAAVCLVSTISPLRRRYRRPVHNTDGRNA